MLFKINDLEEDFKDRLIKDEDDVYFIPLWMKQLAIKEFMNRHHTIELIKHEINSETQAPKESPNED